MLEQNTIKSVADFCNVINKGTFGVQLLAVTEPKMNKRNNPYFGRVQKATYIANIALGYDYENVVNARLIKQGLEPTFKSVAPKGTRFISDFMLEKISDPSVTYLRTTMQGSTSEKHCYYLDGVEVTDKALLNEILSWIPTPSKSAKQSSHGLDENQVVVRNFTTSNIVCLKQGNKVYKVNNDLDLTKYLNLFK